MPAHSQIGTLSFDLDPPATPFFPKACALLKSVDLQLPENKYLAHSLKNTGGIPSNKHQAERAWPRSARRPVLEFNVARKAAGRMSALPTVSFGGGGFFLFADRAGEAAEAEVEAGGEGVVLGFGRAYFGFHFGGALLDEDSHSGNFDFGFDLFC